MLMLFKFAVVTGDNHSNIIFIIISFPARPFFLSSFNDGRHAALAVPSSSWCCRRLVEQPRRVYTKARLPRPTRHFDRSSTMLVRVVVPPSLHVVVVMYTRRHHVAAVSTQQKLCVGGV